MLFSTIVRGVSAGSRVFQYMYTQPTIPLTGGLRLDNVKGAISIRGVTFTYPARPNQVVLNNLSLELQPGQVTALCGVSGAGI